MTTTQIVLLVAATAVIAGTVGFVAGGTQEHSRVGGTLDLLRQNVRLQRLLAAATVHAAGDGGGSPASHLSSAVESRRHLCAACEQHFAHWNANK